MNQTDLNNTSNNKLILLLSHLDFSNYSLLNEELNKSSLDTLFIKNIEGLNDSKISQYEEIVVISFADSKDLYLKANELYKDKIVSNIFVGINFIIPSNEINNLVCWSDNDDLYKNDKYAYKNFKKHKKNKKFNFMCYPLHNHNIHLSKQNENVLDPDFIVDILLFINKTEVKEKIAIVSENHLPFLNGVNILTDLLKKELEKLNKKVYVITIKLKDFDYVKWEENNIKIIRGIPLPGKTAKIQALYMTPNFIGGMKKLRAMQLDYIHVQNEYSLSKVMMMLSKKDNIPLLYTYHTMWDIMFKTKFKKFAPIVTYFANLLLYKPIARFSHMMTVPTNKVIKVWEKKGKTKNIVALPGAVDIDKYSLKGKEDEEEVIRLKEKYNPNNDFLLGFVGRISFEKGVEEIIDYISRIKDEMPDVKYMIVGYGEAYDFLVKYAEKKNVSDKIIFIGEIKNTKLKYYYAMFDAFVTPSTFESQGLTYTEAMSANIPLLVRDDTCLDGFVQNEINGFRYKTFLEFKQYLIRLKNDKGVRESIVNNSKHTINRFRKDVWARKMYLLYKESKKVLNSKRKYLIDFEEVLKKESLN